MKCPPSRCFLNFDKYEVKSKLSMSKKQIDAISYLHADSFSRICTLDISCFVFYTLLRPCNKIYTVTQNNKHSISFLWI